MVPVMQNYVCDNCGYEGRAETDGLTEGIQCPMCGEPVALLALPSDG